MFLLKTPRKNEPDKLKPWKGSAYWNSNVECNVSIDVIMHLLFLGVVKSIKEVMNKFLRKEKNWFKLNERNNKVYNILRSLGLYWLPVIDGNNGWVSENYLGFSRLINWYYIPNNDITLQQIKCNNIKEKRAINCNLIGSLYSMLVSILVRKTSYDQIKKTDRNIQLFLSNLDTFDKLCYREKRDSNNNANKRI